MSHATAKTKRKAPRLERTAFKTSRLMEFCNEKELTNQTGHEPDDWPVVILKELVDNALDACEEAGIPPRITITVDRTGITITDNGPGLPLETLDGVLDYTVRTSSREAYVAPDRGAQGNALKTILPMPFVLGNDEGRVIIATGGERHEIVFSVDPIRQEPQISRQSHPADENAKNGTAITVQWPNSACSTPSEPKDAFLQFLETEDEDDPNSAGLILAEAEERFLQIADDYTFLNPHLTLTVEWFGKKTTVEATDPGWKKWLPSNPTCPHWYEPEHFERLAAAYIAHDQDHGEDRLVREFVKEFRGLTGSAKQKKVLDGTGLGRVRLSDLANGDGLRPEITAPLLEAMKLHTKPVKPYQLGVIGKDHIAKRFEAAGCEMESFEYKKVLEMDDDGLPVVIETAFAWKGEKSEDRRRIITGVNWSPGIVNPFRTLGTTYGDGLAALLSDKYAGPNEPIVFLLHCACPRVQYRDRGKSSVVIK